MHQPACPRTGCIPEEHGLVFQVQDVAHLQEDCSQCKDVDLQHVRDVNEHEGLLFLPAEDVKTRACYLHKHAQLASTADALSAHSVCRYVCWAGTQTAES